MNDEEERKLIASIINSQDLPYTASAYVDGADDTLQLAQVKASKQFGEATQEF